MLLYTYDMWGSEWQWYCFHVLTYAQWQAMGINLSVSRIGSVVNDQTSVCLRNSCVIF